MSDSRRNGLRPGSADDDGITAALLDAQALSAGDGLVDAVGALFARLLGVQVAGLRAHLAQSWGPTDQGLEAAGRALDRLVRLKNSHQIKAGASRAGRGKCTPSAACELVDEMRRQRPRLTKLEAFEQVAQSRHLTPETVRNLYYKGSGLRRLSRKQDR